MLKYWTMLKWLRRACWQVEDAITDAIDWQPHPPPQPPQPPRAAPSPKPKPPTPHYVEWSACGLGDQNTISVEGVDGDLLKKVLAQLGAGHLFEIKRP